jgi:hypothetical protein
MIERCKFSKECSGFKPEDTKPLFGKISDLPGDQPVGEIKPLSFVELAEGVGQLVQEKNEAYGDAFSKSMDFLCILYPAGIKVEQYKDVLVLVRMFDKMMRIASGNQYALGEDAYSDLTGYGLLGMKMEMDSVE